MGVVRSIFLNEHQARTALEQLRAAFSDERINMRSFRSSKAETGFPGDYDPIGGARLTGATMTTLPATGANLVGNSTTLDLSLGELDDILAMVAAGESHGQYKRSSTRIVASVEVDDEHDAERARSIMESCGGRELSIDRTGLVQKPNGEERQPTSEDPDAPDS